MKFLSRQFGEIEYAEEHVFHFDEGIIGFDQLRSFIIINDADIEPFRWLVAIDDEEISLPILDPKLIDSSYETGTQSTDGRTVAVIASLKEQAELSTVNLRSPLVFDPVRRTGKQIILDNERYAIQQRFIGEPQFATGE